MSNLPPVKADLDVWDKQSLPSDRVIVRVKGEAMLDLGHYLHGLSEWRTNRWVNSNCDVVEWWPLPVIGTGRSIPYCKTCGRPMDVDGNPASVDCGGDCMMCMANAGDKDAIARLEGHSK